MKVISLIKLFLLAFTCSMAQVQLDSISQHLNVISSEINLDSTQKNIQQLPDSLLPAFHRIDSIRNNFNLRVNGLQNEYSKAQSKIDTETRRISFSLDSLARLNLPTGHYTRKLDSLQQLGQNTIGKFTSKLDSLKSKTTEKLKTPDLPPEYKEPVQKLTQRVNDLNINADIVKVPGLNIPGYSIPQAGNVPGVSSPIENIPDLSSPVGAIPGPGDISGLPKVDIPKGDLDNISRQAQAYQDDVNAFL